MLNLVLDWCGFRSEPGNCEHNVISATLEYRFNHTILVFCHGAERSCQLDF